MTGSPHSNPEGSGLDYPALLMFPAWISLSLCVSVSVFVCLSVSLRDVYVCVLCVPIFCFIPFWEGLYLTEPGATLAAGNPLV